ncbi:MAG TPA: MarR family winged helix-turn-helix transcriptional regulator [Roseiflexaceae bacterium]|nr:MarR family winged helix-turn-helix transcriptional regulator [Roseiflexaceae bacterium]
MSKLNSGGEAFTELVLETFRVNRLLLDAGDRLTRSLGLSSARWQVLGVVEHGPIPVAHVARVMGLARQSVQQTADALEAEGLIVFRDNPHHRRARLMIMTAKGHAALDEVRVRQAAWANEIASEQTLAEVQTAVTVLRQVRRQLEQRALHTGDASAGEAATDS